ncbi:Uncharacterised protein [Mycobacterium tuberculosis]|nr:Uncharacterised protein [Mycobacterium tuberculosis]
MILTLYNPVDDVFFLVHISVVYQTAFRLTNPLCDDLFCSLRRNTSEVPRRHFDFDNIIQLIVLIHFPRGVKRNLQPRVENFIYNRLARINFNQTCVTVDIDANVLRCIEVPFITGNQSRLDGIDEHFLCNALFSFNFI